jgi:hypothetical protein
MCPSVKDSGNEISSPRARRDERCKGFSDDDRRAAAGSPDLQEPSGDGDAMTAPVFFCCLSYGRHVDGVYRTEAHIMCQ